MSRWLVTGAAGFIGYHVCERLISDGETVFALDNLSDYYDVSLKKARAERLTGREGLEFDVIDIRDKDAITKAFDGFAPDVVVHLAAQAGVRHSLVNPHSYVETNVEGFLNILEACRHGQIPHLVFASSSSVYGANQALPFSVHQGADHPVSLYAATKRANELMAHTYSHLFGLPTTGLRFFTVYGPWGRPDMAAFLFADAILDGKPIVIYGDGSAMRDFTYVDDVVEGVVRVARKIPQHGSLTDDPASSHAPFRLFNIGHGAQVSVSGLIELLEGYLGKEAIKSYEPEQPGDVRQTHADVSDLVEWVGFRPQIDLAEGMRRFSEWFTEYKGR